MPVSVLTPSKPQSQQLPAMRFLKLDSPKICTRKEMCMKNPKECERLRGQRLCQTAPNFKMPRTLVSAPSLSALYTPNKLDSYLDQVFKKVTLMGNGSFGNVLCMRSREDGRFYAIKCSQQPYRSRAHRLEKQREVRFLEQLGHLNVVRFFSAWEENDLLYMQTELCEKSMQSYIFEMDGSIPEHVVWNALVDILRAVEYIHSREIVHVDIKPDNILMTTKQIFKLGDFGMAVDLVNDPMNLDHEGDAKYLAAEALNQERVTKKMDIFSLGLSIFQLATDLWVPTNGKAWHDIRELQFSNEILSRCPTLLLPILLEMMSPEPLERPEAKRLLHRKFVMEKVRDRQLSTMNLVWDDVCSSPNLPTIVEHRGKDILSPGNGLTPPHSRLFDNSSLFTPARRLPRRIFNTLLKS